jgi:two-component system chemotaxis response regulator CheB
MKELIKVLIVDDSPLVCKILSKIINDDPELIVVGIANTGKAAIELVPKLKPHLITMDINMPDTDGFEATRHIMAYSPTPILIVSSSVFKKGMDLVFKALAYGALDVLEKPNIDSSVNGGISADDLTKRIKMLSRVKVITHPAGKWKQTMAAEPVKPSKPAGSPENGKIVAIAASTGGPQALLAILKALPKDFPAGIVIVQHIAAGFAEGLADWLDKECQIPVKLATQGVRIKPGCAYIAPTGSHTRVLEGGMIRLTDEPPFEGQKPSANILFESIAQIYRSQAIGVILSGMGSDGAVGLKKIHDIHGRVIAQDEASCVVFGMPKTAIELGVVNETLPIGQIAQRLIKILMNAREPVS